jgi:hypothetical protein
MQTVRSVLLGIVGYVKYGGLIGLGDSLASVIDFSNAANDAGSARCAIGGLIVMSWFASTS